MIKITYWNSDKQTLDLECKEVKEVDKVIHILTKAKEEVEIQGLSEGIASELVNCIRSGKGEAFYFPPTVRVILNIKRKEGGEML